MSLITPPAKSKRNIRRVAILFAGGPAPAANAVISTAAVSFLRNDIEVVGILNGYSRLDRIRPDKPLVEDRDYIMHRPPRAASARATRQGIMIGTARTNPGKRRLASRRIWTIPQRAAPLQARVRRRCARSASTP